ncbi:MAG: PAS domain S-box protein [Brevundimonas sp.]|nr:MAG: PAS domain S-box protein [Brevundimonas sp.]
MFLLRRRSADTTGELAERRAMLAAVQRSQAVIEFDLDGTIRTANANFLSVVGYDLDEIRGRHHSLFMDPAEAASADYKAFWRRLNAGEFIADKFVRYGKGGARAVIEASYNPILDAAGKPYKVVKFATDVTAAEIEREQRAEADRREAEIQTRVVDDTGRGLAAMAAGDLSCRITSDFPGRYAPLRENFNAAMGAMDEAMDVIRANAGTMQSGASEISHAAEDLSRRTERQAASLEETAAALDQITATVRKTAENALSADTVVGQARAQAQDGGEVVQRAVTAMGEIERSSDQIGQIIGVIDEIAFQTNLLALNAGVEAARAGDAGRGFAVVASEVRALAQRSADSAREIKTLISASGAQVKDGVVLVRQSGEALTGIVSRIGEITGLMGEIRASTQEQASGLAQVNTAVNDMDQVTQQNAAMVEESTAASLNLNREAAALADLVGRFQVSNDHRPAPLRAAEARIEAFARRA